MIKIIKGIWINIEGNSNKLIIFSHGFLSNKNRPIIKYVANKLSDSFMTLRFNYDTEVVSERISKLKTIINYFKDKIIGLFGVSMGGMVSLLCANHPNVKSLALVNPVYNQKKVLDNYFSIKKFTSLFLPKKAVDDFLSYDLASVASNLKKPTLLITGDRDRLITRDIVEELFSKLGGEKEHFVLSDCGHSVWKKEHLDMVSQITHEWFSKTL